MHHHKENFTNMQKGLNKNQMPNSGINTATIITEAAKLTNEANNIANAGEIVLNKNLNGSQIATLGQYAQDAANAAKSAAINTKQISIDMKKIDPSLSKQMKEVSKKSDKASKKAQHISNMCQFKITNSQSYIKINRFQQPRSDFDRKMNLKWA